jgi:hypothetical protein
MSPKKFAWESQGSHKGAWKMGALVGKWLCGIWFHAQARIRKKDPSQSCTDFCGHPDYITPLQGLLLGNGVVCMYAYMCVCMCVYTCMSWHRRNIEGKDPFLVWSELTQLTLGRSSHFWVIHRRQTLESGRFIGPASFPVERFSSLEFLAGAYSVFCSPYYHHQTMSTKACTRTRRLALDPIWCWPRCGLCLRHAQKASL